MPRDISGTRQDSTAPTLLVFFEASTFMINSSSGRTAPCERVRVSNRIIAIAVIDWTLFIVTFDTDQSPMYMRLSMAYLSLNWHLFL